MKVPGLKKTALGGIFATLLCFSESVEAQKVYRISALVAEDQFVSAFEGFKKKMAELGYIEGKNVKYDFHNAKGDLDTLGKLTQDRKSTRLNSSHIQKSRMPSSA